MSSETFNKDREARKQYVIKIIGAKDGNSIQPNEIKNISAYIQAPHQKGRKSIKILIYYNVPSGYPKVK